LSCQRDGSTLVEIEDQTHLTGILNYVNRNRKITMNIYLTKQLTNQSWMLLLIIVIGMCKLPIIQITVMPNNECIPQDPGQFWVGAKLAPERNYMWNRLRRSVQTYMRGHTFGGRAECVYMCSFTNKWELNL